jgi:hypothetical protein
MPKETRLQAIIDAVLNQTHLDENTLSSGEPRRVHLVLYMAIFSKKRKVVEGQHTKCLLQQMHENM